MIWGLSPIFWKLIQGVSAYEMLAHRVVWCLLIMLAVVTRGRQWKDLGRALSQGKVRAALLLSTILIGANWFLYIYAITTDRILHASLGYFINPLVSVLMGVVFLGERLRRAQLVSVAIACVGVAVLAFRLGHLPWISLTLAVSFAVYGLVRKTVDATPEQGLTLETALLVPLALLYLARVHGVEGGGSFGQHGWQTDLLLVLTGVITAVPLLWFTHGARRLPLSTVGLLQYLAPTCQFLLAVLVYREPFDRMQLLAFVFIWIALFVFTFDARRQFRADRAARPPIVPDSL